MLTCNLMGGLGNQLFQIFTTISYSIKSRNPFKFINVHSLGNGCSTIRYTFWNSFLSRFKPFLIDNYPQPIHIISEKEFIFNDLPVNEMIGRDTIISGYFQSYKYFQENYEMICKLIGIANLKEDLQKKLKLESDYLQNCVSMHFRIGDYKNLQNYHPLLTYTYYNNCLDFLKNKFPNQHFTIIYFCEEVDIEDVLNIVNKLEKEYSDYKFIRGKDTLEDWQQMLLMSCCHHNIIANSSFSWWGAYFNSWSDKCICYPSIWFGPSANHNTKDLCPNEWNKISA